MKGKPMGHRFLRFPSFAAMMLVMALFAPASPFAHAAPAAPDLSSSAARRAPVLARGINLSNWFQGADVSADHIAKYTTPADLKVIHDLNFTYVRLGVDPTQFTRYGLDSGDCKAAIARLDRAIDEILAARLAVTLTVFPTDDYKRTLSTQSGADNFMYLWRYLAHHYASADPNRVFFELINEPVLNDPYRWDGLQAATVAAIRQTDAAHTVIATASFYSGIAELLRVTPMRDANVLYNFHFYEPFPFTHQGANWGSFEWNFYRDVPYPATPDALRTALANVPDDSARYTLFLYGATGWNRAAIQSRIGFAKAWADAHGVPLICNEFGAYRERAPRDSRLRYLRDVRSSLEALGIGWAMWDYSGDFGIVTHAPDGHAIPDAGVVDALGLTPPR